MTRERTTTSPSIERYAIDAGIRRAHQLRSQYLKALLTGLVKKIVGWNRKYALRRRFDNMPEYLLKDIGIERDQVGALVSGDLRRDPLSLSPAGSQSAPAFQGVSAPVAENSNSEPDRQLAA
ncbi:MAG: hypothetical protein IH994_12860 [Proteobacteria bacterium]|nr:hypothetical protein [Pseudomonadota bacterium]